MSSNENNSGLGLDVAPTGSIGSGTSGIKKSSADPFESSMSSNSLKNQNNGDAMFNVDKHEI